MDVRRAAAEDAEDLVGLRQGRLRRRRLGEAEERHNDLRVRGGRGRGREGVRRKKK